MAWLRLCKSSNVHVYSWPTVTAHFVDGCVQVVFGRVPKTASAPTSPSVSRCSTPAPSELDDDEANEDDDDDVADAESEEEREELNKREPAKRDLTASLREATPNPGDILPAHSA